MFKIRKFLKAKLWVKVIAVGIPLAFIGYLVWHFVVTPWISCGPGVARIDGQCISVTDGEVPLSEDLKDVLGKIRQENERIEGENLPTVSVAYLIPLPKHSENKELPVDMLRLRHELQGAHILQLQANRTEKLGDQPRIRLLVANSGDESSHRERVVSALLDRINGPDRLVAVVATGSTVNGTLKAIEDLRSGGLPVVMSALAGDSSAAPDTNLRGAVARLTPNGREHAAAAAAYLKDAYLKSTTSRAVIVRDMNPGDPYVKTLEESFRDAFPEGTHTVLERPETYDSRFPVSNSMRGILLNICAKKPDIVYFAGRIDALESFIEQLPLRSCPEIPINIMIGNSGTVDLSAKIKQGDRELTDGLNATASLLYTARGHPDAWATSPESFLQEWTSHLTESFEFCFTTVFPGETLEDGGAMIGSDAILVAVSAIRPVQGIGINDTPDLVSQQFKRLNGIAAVHGVTGWISLDEYGDPLNKAVVVLEVESDGTVKFLKLSSPIGSPCVPGTPPC